uniref:Uncharacterized protein n=1 Tax=Oryza nivara TaxID=4536 RepID=A0A0E0I0K6_ORYNI
MATALCHAGGRAGDWRFSDARPRLREVSALTAAETATDDILVASPDVVMTSVAGKMSWSTGERDVEIPKKTYPKNGSFWGARVAGAVVQQDDASLFGAVPPPTWWGDAEMARGSAPEWLAPPPPEIFYFCFIYLIFFSRLGTHKNQP